VIASKWISEVGSRAKLGKESKVLPLQTREGPDKCPFSRSGVQSPIPIIGEVVESYSTFQRRTPTSTLLKACTQSREMILSQQDHSNFWVVLTMKEGAK
jgi:hypothetical protein